jgi:hypothetical protein
MARISTYPVDDNISGNDKLIGSEALTNLTKNYTVQKVGEFLRDRGVVTGGIQLVYSFQNDVTEYDNGQFMLSTSGGNAVAMSAITSIVINKAEIGGLDTEVLLRQMLTDNIAIYGADVKNTFGEYEAGAITENGTSLIVALTVVASNGSLVDGDRYYISKIPAAIASWGNITGTITNQTDLVNYITSRLSSDTINDAADVLQVLENAGLTLGEEAINAKVPFTIFGKDENGDIIVIPNTTTPLGYTLPKPSSELLTQGVPYIMVTKSDGTNVNLSWLNLGFALGVDNTVSLDGGTFT